MLVEWDSMAMARTTRVPHEQNFCYFVSDANDYKVFARLTDTPAQLPYRPRLCCTCHYPVITTATEKWMRPIT